MSNSTKYLSPKALVFPFIFSFYLSKHGETILQIKDTFCGETEGENMFLWGMFYNGKNLRKNITCVVPKHLAVQNPTSIARVGEKKIGPSGLRALSRN